ncbi:MAG: DUF4288 domain-containing protein [Gemmatimonadales bacterium]
MSDTPAPDGKSWYKLLILFECRVLGASPESQFCEEQLVLLSATSIEHARLKGEAYVAAHRTVYKNDSDEDVEWAFLRILSIEELLDSPDEAGWEVASRLIDCPPPEAPPSTH